MDKGLYHLSRIDILCRELKAQSASFPLEKKTGRASLFTNQLASIFVGF